jgi:hypothetical protein
MTVVADRNQKQRCVLLAADLRYDRDIARTPLRNWQSMPPGRGVTRQQARFFGDTASKIE